MEYRISYQIEFHAGDKLLEYYTPRQMEIEYLTDLSQMSFSSFLPITLALDARNDHIELCANDKLQWYIESGKATFNNADSCRVCVSILEKADGDSEWIETDQAVNFEVTTDND